MKGGTVTLLFELLSNGGIARLPGDMPHFDLPHGCVPRVALYAPYNRMLVGASLFGCFEYWFWGGERHAWEETTLYDGAEKRFSLGVFGDLVLNAEAVGVLRRELLGHLAPPGEHELALLLLREALRTDTSQIFAALSRNEEIFSELVRDDAALRNAYWGFRLATSTRDQEMVLHIRTWLRVARDAFDQSLRLPRLWVFLTGAADEASLRDLSAIGFTETQLRNLDSETSDAAVLHGPGGYLLQFWQEENAEDQEWRFPMRIWLYLTSALWEDLRLYRKVSVRDMVYSAMGYLEALDAAARMEQYGSPDDMPKE